MFEKSFFFIQLFVAAVMKTKAGFTLHCVVLFRVLMFIPKCNTNDLNIMPDDNII